MAVIESCTELSLLDLSGCENDADGVLFEKQFDFDLLLADHKTRLVMVVGGTDYPYGLFVCSTSNGFARASLRGRGYLSF